MYDLLKPEISDKEFEERFVTLHKQLFASLEFEFNDVTTHIYKPPEGYYQVDHSLAWDGKNWHLFYITGNMKNSEVWIKAYRAGDYEEANRVCLEPGNGHAVGKTLFELKFKENLFFPSQGKFDLASRACAYVTKYEDGWVMFYDVRGEGGQSKSLAFSKDLNNWELYPHNPVMTYPKWADKYGACKDTHIVKKWDYYLIYYVVMDLEGYSSVALAMTKDFKKFEDLGCVFRVSPNLRGTMGIESPCVIERNGMWHLFITYGPGLWHAVSNRPTKFVGRFGKESWSVGTGFYFIGHFHATEIFQDNKGNWWMTTDRKEKSRRLNREKCILCYRGSYEDEKVLEEGLYFSHIRWHGDQPILERPI